MAVTRLGIDRRDDPIRGDSTGDTERAVGGLLQILTHDRCQELCRLIDSRRPWSAFEDKEKRLRILGQGIHQLIARLFALPVAGWFPSIPVIIVSVEGRS